VIDVFEAKTPAINKPGIAISAAIMIARFLRLFLSCVFSIGKG
jgi:hypothetical protein